MIVDTGLHYVGFTRDKALKYFSKYAWDDTDIAKKEVKTTGITCVFCHCLASFPASLLPCPLPCFPGWHAFSSLLFPSFMF